MHAKTRREWASYARPVGTMVVVLAAALRAPAALGATAPLGQLHATLPAITNDALSRTPTFVKAPGGRVGLLTFELDDDYDAVQIGMLNQYTTGWGLAGAVVAPSASYGGDPAIGAAAYDLDGRPLTQMPPVQWSHGGADSAAPGSQVLSLPTAAAAAAGATTLGFANTAGAPAFGGAPPGLGWYVADGLGCIADGTTVGDLSATTVSLSTPVAGAGCAAGQAIHFSPQPFGPLGWSVPASATFGALSVSLSDWVPLRSLPRTDGGFAPGAAVSGAGVADGTTLTQVGYTSLTLSQPLAAALPAHAPLVLTTTRTPGQDVAAASSTLTLDDAAGVRAGQTVGGTAAIPPGTHVAAVSGTAVTLDQATTDIVPAGTPLRFANTTWTSLPAAAGDATLAVPSTSGRPLLHLRYFVQPGSAFPSHAPKCQRNPLRDTLPCEAPLGLPPVWSLGGAETTGRLPIDGLNFVARVGAGAGTPLIERTYPSIFVRFLGRHAGATLLVCGAYQVSGSYSSVSGEAAPARIAAAWANMQAPTTPISVVEVASQQVGPDNNFANCTTMTDLLRPGMVMLQGYSNNGKVSVADYRARVRSAAEHVLEIGSLPIIYVSYAESAAHLGSLPVAGDVANATTVPLLTGIARTVSGSPTLVVGPGVPPDTTATSVQGEWAVTLSQPATIPAGSVLHFAHQVAHAEGTNVSLTHRSFASDANATVSAPQVAGKLTMTVTRNLTTARLSAPTPLDPGTVLQLSNPTKPGPNTYVAAAQTYYGQTDAWEAVRFDALGTIGIDPAHPTWMCDACSTGGLYANDYGNSLLAAALVPLLRQLTTPASPAPP